jgi:hypothetical protein
VKDELVERLRAAFARPEHWVAQTHGVPAARAQVLLREHVVRRLDEALTRAGARALVVKGEALARTVYPEPWMRFMTDIDLVLPDEDERGVARELLAAGFERDLAPVGRQHSLAALDETRFILPIGDGAFVVEVHGGLDKVVRRSIDFVPVMQRAELLGDSLLLPTNVDQILMVVLHAATSDFDHAHCWLDLHLLLGTSFSLPDLLERAERWELRTALYVAMNALRHAGSERVPDALLEHCRPGPLRRRALKRYFAPDRFPMHAGGRPYGISWAIRQVPLRDDTLKWMRGCARYGAIRVIERITS